jgi:Tol biopolymer transport system component
VVDLKTGKVISSPTATFRKLQGNNGYLYNEALQPLYNGTNTLTGYILVTHPKSEQGQSWSEVWHIKPDGTPIRKLVQPRLGNHGCQISPDEQYLVCEDDTDNHFLWLAKFDGTQLTHVRWGAPETRVPIGVVSWSSDSKGFAFYACNLSGDGFCDHNAGGFLVYYDLQSKTMTPLAEDLSPAFFCYPWLTPTCVYTAAGGSEIPASSPAAQPGIFYYSTVSRSTTQGQRHRVLVRVSRDNPNAFEPLTLHEHAFTEPTHPVVSPDGTRIAFIANPPESNESNKIVALYIMNLSTLKSDRIRSIRPGDDVYAVHWQDASASAFYLSDEHRRMDN